jgi:cinnamoyl-CoA:phenyllactate CoA-transferase
MEAVEMSEKKRPLEGVKVTELATFIAAPCCTRYLADLGARVVKVETVNGDSVRYLATNEGRPPGDEENTTFTLENAGKECVILNLKTDAGKEAFHKLLAESDVFVTNLRPNALTRAGLDYDTLKTNHPKLVMGVVSGYGEKGPDKDLPGYDFTSYFARGGISGTMYDEDALPMLPIAGFGDHQVGVYLASGILSALYRARETGEGDRVTVSLYQAALWATGIYLTANQYGAASTHYPISRKRLANQLQIAHKTKDGRWVQIALPQYDHFWPIFCGVIGRAELADDARYFPQTNAQENLEEIYGIVGDEFAKRTAEEWQTLLAEADLPFSVCLTWDEILRDEQAWANDYLTNVTFRNGVTRAMVRTPVTFADTPLPPYESAAYLGEHTKEVLARLGYSDAQIEAMIEAGEATGVRRDLSEAD